MSGLEVTSQRRRVITDSMETILQGEYGPPLDYSFRNISSLSSLPTKYPRQSLRKQRRSPSGRLDCQTRIPTLILDEQVQQ